MREERTPPRDRRLLQSYDPATGEHFEGAMVLVGRKIRSPYGRRWMQVNQDAIELLAADKELTFQAVRVFMFLNGRLDFENWIRVPQSEISEALGMKQPNVSRAVKLLERKGIILPGPKVDRSSVWRLNPHYGWKGKVVNFQKAQAERRLQLVKNAAAGPEAQQEQPSADDRQLPLL